MNGKKSKEHTLKSEEEISGLLRLLKRLKNRMIVSNLQSTSIVSYSRAARKRSLLVSKMPIGGDGGGENYAWNKGFSNEVLCEGQEGTIGLKTL